MYQSGRDQVTVRAIRAGLTYLGAYAPNKIITNEDLERTLDTSDEWIRTRTGIRKRHVAADDEFTSDMAIRSVEDLIARNGKSAIEGVELVIVATNTPDAFFPATAALVQNHFELQAGGFDLLAACPGWIYALSAARAYVESGQFSKVLAIGSEALTKVVDWEDRATAVLFGDGAGACVVEAVPEPFIQHRTRSFTSSQMITWFLVGCFCLSLHFVFFLSLVLSLVFVLKKTSTN